MRNNDKKTFLRSLSIGAAEGFETWNFRSFVNCATHCAVPSEHGTSRKLKTFKQTQTGKGVIGYERAYPVLVFLLIATTNVIILNGKKPL
jgi:hypothetical protein